MELRVGDILIFGEKQYTVVEDVDPLWDYYYKLRSMDGSLTEHYFPRSDLNHWYNDNKVGVIKRADVIKNRILYGV